MAVDPTKIDSPGVAGAAAAVPATGSAQLRTLTGRRQPWWVGAALLVGSLAPAVVDPNRAGRWPTCPFYALTGLYCPGCGGLRAVHALWHGHVGEAFGLNPLLVGLLPLGVAAWAGWVLRARAGRPALRTPAWAVLVGGGVVFAFGVLRNLPGFEMLAP